MRNYSNEGRYKIGEVVEREDLTLIIKKQIIIMYYIKCRREN